jgi:murein DD-endopeptidase MepM/ murein hydrolase activator NlpD
MIRRITIALVLLGAVATPAFGDDIRVQKQKDDLQISHLQVQLAGQKRDESALRGQIDTVTSRIRALEGQVGDVSLRLSTLEADLALHKQRLTKLGRLFRLQTVRLNGLKQQYAYQLNVLARRLVTIYEQGQPTTLDFVIGATSLDDMLAKADYATLIGKEDRRIADQVKQAKLAMQAARKHTIAVRARVHGEQRTINARAAQVRATRDALVGARNSLTSTEQKKLVALNKLTASEQEAASEIDALQASSDRIAEQIRAEQLRSNAGQPVSTPSSAGLIWPVSGPITSPFGWRWGRMHQGIDIGVPSGTPIHAAAAGTVIYCGWEEGYGNFVVLDNGGDLATAYGHQSSIAVTCGQQVNQGDIIGYTGCTGHCFGPHLHFEVRINGNPVDPLGYL